MWAVDSSAGSADSATRNANSPTGVGNTPAAYAADSSNGRGRFGDPKRRLAFRNSQLIGWEAHLGDAKRRLVHGERLTGLTERSIHPPGTPTQ
jgi:hypothetical protein